MTVGIGGTGLRAGPLAARVRVGLPDMDRRILRHRPHR